MGFNLNYFFEELQYMVSHSVSHTELLKFIKEMKEYAKECGKLE